MLLFVYLMTMPPFKVFIVEDNAALLKSIQLIFEKNGFKDPICTHYRESFEKKRHASYKKSFDELTISSPLQSVYLGFVTLAAKSADWPSAHTRACHDGVRQIPRSRRCGSRKTTRRLQVTCRKRRKEYKSLKCVCIKS